MSILRVFSNSSAQVVAKILTIIIGIATVKILTYGFGASGYGLYAKVHNYAAIFAALADLGLFTITVREISAHASDTAFVRRLISHVTGLRFFLGVLLSGVAILGAFFLPGYSDPVTILAVVITQIFVIFGLIYSSYLSYLQAKLRSEFSLVASLIGRGVTVLLMIAVVASLSRVGADMGLILIFVSALVGNILMTFILGWYTRQFEKISLSFSWSYFGKLIRNNLWYIAAIFFSTIFLRVDVFMISLIEPSSIADAQVGYYSVAIKLVEVAIYFGTIVLNSFLPLFVASSGIRRSARALDERKIAFLVLLLSGIAFGSICSLFSEFIIRIISDVSFVTVASPLLIVVCWSVVFHFLGLFFSYQLITSGSYHRLFWLNLIVFLINVILNAYGIIHFSLMGAAVASLISQFVFFVGGLIVYMIDLKSDQNTLGGQAKQD